VANVPPPPGRAETFAFRFDPIQLFEEFIAGFIRRELREVWQSRNRCILYAWGLC
jgi:5-methylcytosine-specific restriction endonuclease McrBC regulatory subunit McrC